MHSGREERRGMLLKLSELGDSVTRIHASSPLLVEASGFLRRKTSRSGFSGSLTRRQIPSSETVYVESGYAFQWTRTPTAPALVNIRSTQPQARRQGGQKATTYEESRRHAAVNVFEAWPSFASIHRSGGRHTHSSSLAIICFLDRRKIRQKAGLYRELFSYKRSRPETYS